MKAMEWVIAVTVVMATHVLWTLVVLLGAVALGKWMRILP